MPTSATEKIILIGLNISYYRRVRHLTQVERAYKSISLVKLLKIAEVLGVDEKNFFDFSKSPNFV